MPGLRGLDGFITPLIYGLVALMEVTTDGVPTVRWKVDDPMAWLTEHLPSIVRRYSDVLVPWGHDPQKVGKAPGSYNSALDAYKMALAGLD